MSVINLIEFVSCTFEYNVAIETEIGMKSVSADFGPIPNLKSVFIKNMCIYIYFFKIPISVSAQNRFGIGIPNLLIGIPKVGISFHHYCTLFLYVKFCSSFH